MDTNKMKINRNKEGSDDYLTSETFRARCAETRLDSMDALLQNLRVSILSAKARLEEGGEYAPEYGALILADLVGVCDDLKYSVTGLSWGATFEAIVIDETKKGPTDGSVFGWDEKGARRLYEDYMYRYGAGTYQLYHCGDVVEELVVPEIS